MADPTNTPGRRERLDRSAAWAIRQYDEAALPPIPPAICASVAYHVAALHAWNAAILQARAMEAVAGQPGRYEYDLRATDAGATLRETRHRALCYLALAEETAAMHGLTPAALYAACGGKPVLLEDGAHVWEWGRREE